MVKDINDNNINTGDEVYYATYNGYLIKGVISKITTHRVSIRANHTRYSCSCWSTSHKIVKIT